MGKIAFVFAGQGAQTTGMGQTLQQAGGKAAEIFALADTIRPGTSTQCFTAGADVLNLTINTQPCVFTVDLAAAEALREKGVVPHAVAGFSLGELAALTFAGCIEQQASFSLVTRRAELMHEAAAAQPGSMAAVLRLDDETVENLCRQFNNLWPVNYNADGQLVVAGDAQQIPAFCEAVKASGGIAKQLAVSGAFHSPFMQNAATRFLQELEGYTLTVNPEMPVYANLTAAPYAGDIKQTLASQIHSPVLWKQTMLQMHQDGFDTFIEVGPGKTLTGLAKRIVPSARLFNVYDENSLQETLQNL